MRIARVSGWIVVLMCASAMVAAAQISRPGGERLGTVHVELEDATEKSPITPGPNAPVHELLGERLLDANRPADALKEFEVNLTPEPNRFRMSDGAGHPAEFAEDRVTRFAQSPQYPLLPRELEIELALSAAPKHLRSEATVWTLDQTGYKVAKKGTNAFSCIVSRRAGDLFPVCWDAEGARSLLPLDFDDAQMRLAGKPGTEIEAVVAQRFKSGDYHPPARAGIAYMLSPMRYRIDEHGVVSRTASNPHLMFYGPNLTDTDIGGARGAFVFINRVGPDGMMIVPVGEKEREAIVSDAQSLIAQVEQAIGYQPSR